MRHAPVRYLLDAVATGAAAGRVGGGELLVSEGLCTA